MKKKSYIQPKTTLVALRGTAVMQSASEVTVHRDEETNVDDVQLSRQYGSIWGEEE